ncbi:winged helix-turn-helix domain-containing protein [Streptomyces sp. NPDC058442]|uniref:winged helix-turn-helix domain-containing protein n=1 Tax=Streptomyces sp. NPDC058442 TaxID=3346503 RepID=UPI003647AAED
MTDLPRYEYVKLADAIAAEIASGKLPQGAALPGERAMTDLYRVSIGTVRRAIVELRKRGLVATLPAKGTYVIGQPGTPGNEEGTSEEEAPD